MTQPSLPNSVVAVILFSLPFFLFVDLCGGAAVVGGDDDLLSAPPLCVLSLLGRNDELDMRGMNEDDLMTLCTLSGCDYLPSVHGMGLKKAYRMVSRHKEASVFSAPHSSSTSPTSELLLTTPKCALPTPASRPPHLWRAKQSRQGAGDTYGVA